METKVHRAQGLHFNWSQGRSNERTQDTSECSVLLLACQDGSGHIFRCDSAIGPNRMREVIKGHYLRYVKKKESCGHLKWTEVS